MVAAIPGYKDKIPASAATAVTAADMFIFGHYYDTRVTTYCTHYCAVQGFIIADSSHLQGRQNCHGNNE